MPVILTLLCMMIADERDPTANLPLQATGRSSHVVGAVQNPGPRKDAGRKLTPRERYDQRSQRAQEAQKPVRQNPNQNQWRSERGWGNVDPSNDYAGPSGELAALKSWTTFGTLRRGGRRGGGVGVQGPQLLSISSMKYLKCEPM